MTRPLGWPAASLALLTVVLWSANPVAVRFSVDVLPPVAVAGVRFLLACGVMFVWCRWEGAGFRLRPDQLGPTLLAGIGLFLQIATFHIGVNLSSASHAAMMINTFVLWVILVEHFVTRDDRLTAPKLIGVALAMGGVLLLFSRGSASPPLEGKAMDAPSLAGDLVLLLSALLLAVKVVYVKQALKVVEPGKLIFWHDVVGVCLFAVYSLMFEEIRPGSFTPAAMIAIGYQGLVVAGLCFAIQAVLLRRHSASQITIFSFATPLFGVGFGVLLRNDPLTPWLFAATFCVAVGILLVNWRPAHSR